MTEGDINGSALRKKWSRENVGPRSQALLSRDEHAFLHQSLSTPCLSALVSAQGSWLEDADGRRYLDFHGNMVHQIGHKHPKVVASILQQLETLPFSPRRYTNEPATLLAEKLGALAPAGLDKVLFVPGGSEAIGLAVRLARLVTGRHKMISMWDAFHGASLDAASVGGEERFRRDVGPLLPGTEHAPPSDPFRCPLGCGGTCNLNCASYLEYVLEKEGDVAAVIAEPIRCTTVVAPPAEYWKRIRTACDKLGALLIFDEIPTALGRTGRMFAHEWFDVVPDILVLGKGLGGGVLPLAGIVTRREFDEVAAYSIGHYTHEKSPICCAAGLAAIEVIESECLVARSEELGAKTLKKLQNLSLGHRSIVDVRGKGLLFGIELEDSANAEACLYGCLSNGLSFKISAGTVLTLAPPLNISEADLERALEILGAVMNDLD